MAQIANYRADTLLYSYKKVQITTADPIAGYIEGRDSADQPIQITFTFFHSPFVQVPKVGEYWLITRLDNNWVLHSRFETGNEANPAMDLKGGDVRIEAPGHLLIDASEVIVDFNKAAPSLAQLGTATLPGSALYGSATLDQINVGTANVTDKVISPFNSFLPSRNVVNGQEANYLYLLAEEEVLWKFKYNANSDSSYKWYYAGGVEHMNYRSTGTATSGTGWSTAGMTQTIPYTGEYIYAGGAIAVPNNNNTIFYIGLRVNGTVVASVENYADIANRPVTTFGTFKSTFTKGDIVESVQRAASGTVTLTQMWSSVKPVKVMADPTEDPEPVVETFYTGAG
jgi:hypothetical protein